MRIRTVRSLPKARATRPATLRCCTPERVLLSVLLARLLRRPVPRQLLGRESLLPVKDLLEALVYRRVDLHVRGEAGDDVGRYMTRRAVRLRDVAVALGVDLLLATVRRVGALIESEESRQELEVAVEVLGDAQDEILLEIRELRRDLLDRRDLEDPRVGLPRDEELHRSAADVVVALDEVFVDLERPVLARDVVELGRVARRHVDRREEPRDGLAHHRARHDDAPRRPAAQQAREAVALEPARTSRGALWWRGGAARTR
mmetsp:Transcript_793/g.3148  ORF Transcript_793/g.3148 Transcript_793/m.3148 type:complete len:260 (+) Transcript_793:141-920(+)